MRDIEEIKRYGEELEKILKQDNLDQSVRALIKKAIKFGYKVGKCEEKYDQINEPYNSSGCIEKYEEIRAILRGQK